MGSASRYWFSVGLALVVSAAACGLTPKTAAAQGDWQTSATDGPRKDGRRFSRITKKVFPWTRESQPPDSAVRHAAAGLPGLEPEAGAIQQTSGSIIEAPFKAISSGFKTGAEKVSEAFTPSVRKADDPTSLSTAAEPNAQLYLAMARLAEEGGRIAEAEQRYRQALKTAPDDLAALVGYARMKDRQGDKDGAVELYRRAVKAHPDNAMVHNDLGLCLARQKQLPEALTSLEQAVKLDAKQALYRNNIATVLVEMGNVDAAYSHLAAVHPPAVAYYNVGYLLYKKNQPQAAASLFAQAIRIDPSFEQARVWLAKINGVPTTPNAAGPTRGFADGRLEDPSVGAPDLRAMRSQGVLPARRTPAVYGAPQNAPRPIPSFEDESAPRATSPQATAPKPLLPRFRQLPPLLESNRRSGAVLPQSWEESSPPQEMEPAGRKTEEPPASQGDSEVGEAELSDGDASPQPEEAPPAPLPEDVLEASPLP